MTRQIFTKRSTENFLHKWRVLEKRLPWQRYRYVDKVTYLLEECATERKRHFIFFFCQRAILSRTYIIFVRHTGLPHHIEFIYQPRYTRRLMNYIVVEWKIDRRVRNFRRSFAAISIVVIFAKRFHIHCGRSLVIGERRCLKNLTRHMYLAL